MGARAVGTKGCLASDDGKRKCCGGAGFARWNRQTLALPIDDIEGRYSYLPAAQPVGRQYERNGMVAFAQHLMIILPESL